MVPSGEPLMFWVDLSTAGLVDSGFSSATSTVTYLANPTSNPPLRSFWPEAKIGGGNYINVYSDVSVNYFGLSATANINSAASYANVGMTVKQAFSIDSKMDDGLPAGGKVVAQYANGFSCQALNGSCAGTLYSNTVAAASSLTCFDNNNVYGIPKQYSIAQNNGNGVNCALSFKFQ